MYNPISTEEVSSIQYYYFLQYVQRFLRNSHYLDVFKNLNTSELTCVNLPMDEPKTYLARYQCTGCKHKFHVLKGGFGCPPEHQEHNPDTPCGRSQRRYRCSGCVQNPSCDKCGSLWVEWTNYAELSNNLW